MGSDQIDAIVSIGGRGRSAAPRPTPDNVNCHCPRAPGAVCPQRSRASVSFATDAAMTKSLCCGAALTKSEVRFQAVECDCHCITCSYRTPGNSDRSIDDNALPPSVLAALAREDDDEDHNGPTTSRTNDDEDVVDDEDEGGITVGGSSFAPLIPLPSSTSEGNGTDIRAEVSLSENNSFPAAMLPEEACIREDATGPCPRYGHSLTEFFPGHFLLFGGTDGTKTFNDLFVLIRGKRPDDGRRTPCCPAAPQRQSQRSSWTELRPLIQPPSPRFGHTCHLHHDKRQLIFFGGSDNQTWFNDMFTLPLHPTMGISRTFEAVTPPIPTSENSSAARASANHHMVPCPRRGHTLVPYRDGRCVLYGGHSRVSLNDVWFLEPDLSWTEILTAGCVPDAPFEKVPEPRYGHTAVVYHDRMFVFGGFCATGPADPYVWSLHLETHVWELLDTAIGITEAPCRRFGHTASLVGCRMVIFGGMDGFPVGRSLNDAFQLNLETLEWTKLVLVSDQTSLTPDQEDGMPPLGPQARRSHAAALDSSGGRVIIFGGWGDCAEVHRDRGCLEMEVQPPTLREVARNWIGSRVVYPRSHIRNHSPVAPTATAETRVASGCET